MLRLAGAEADGTITWCTGPITLEEQIVPGISKAAADAGRPAPRVVVALPCCVTDDESSGRSKADSQLQGYGQIPVYRAVLDLEGAASPAATDFVAIPCGSDDDRTRTIAHLASLVTRA
jgi:alkanesulfonate monooxygenase SsuD/methylene tetrahydromethanopterin reductase-like flavin-dependent oxidoreductase (luciferase family)